MLGHTGIHYRLRKAILAASILLLVLILFEFVFAQTGGLVNFEVISMITQTLKPE